MHDLHAAPAAAVGGLDGDGPADLVAELDDFFRVLQGLTSSGHAFDAGLRGGEATRDLVAHDLDGFGRGTDEGDAARRDRARELGVLREEAVARVHGVGAGACDDVKDRLGVEVALGGALAAERVGLVG